MKKQIKALVLGGLMLHGGSLSAMQYQKPTKKQSTQQIVQDLLAMNDEAQIKNSLLLYGKQLLQYREENTENTLLHRAVLVQNIPLIKAILSNESIGSPKSNHRQILEQCFTADGFGPKDLPLRWAYNEENQTALELAKASGKAAMIRLFN